MTTRFFLWSYGSTSNFNISKSKGILGFPEGGDNSYRKALTLKPGDIVLIRDSSVKDHLKFHGHCVVTDPPYHDTNNLIWPDGIYPYRVRVDFDLVYIRNLHRIDWKDILNLKWRNKKGLLLDKKSLSVLFSKGNPIEGQDAERLENLLLVARLGETKTASDLNQQSGPSRVLTQDYRIIRDTRLTRKIKFLHAFKCQICGTSLDLTDGKKYAEAHHIKPLGSPHNGPDVLGNIICVCPNHHALLDYRAIRLDGNMLQDVDEHKVAEEYINHHNTEIFGR